MIKNDHSGCQCDASVGSLRRVIFKFSVAHCLVMLSGGCCWEVLHQAKVLGKARRFASSKGLGKD